MEAFVGYCLKLARIGHLLAGRSWWTKASRPRNSGSARPRPLKIRDQTERRNCSPSRQCQSRAGSRATAYRGNGACRPLVSARPVPKWAPAPVVLACLVSSRGPAGRCAQAAGRISLRPGRKAELALLANEEQLSVPVLFVAASVGDGGSARIEARRLAERLLEHKGGYDPAYALLLELGGDDLEARLDALARRDRFEERPLIWKAKLQTSPPAARTKRKKTVRAAIAIDPSDGEGGQRRPDVRQGRACSATCRKRRDDMDQAKIMRMGGGRGDPAFGRRRRLVGGGAVDARRENV